MWGSVALGDIRARLAGLRVLHGTVQVSVGLTMHFINAPVLGPKANLRATAN